MLRGDSMQNLENLLNQASSIVWGPLTLALLLGVGIYLTLGLRLMPLRKLIQAFRLLLKGPGSTDAGDITPFQALMTALSATIGTGNIAGVATAIFLGGPGAVFWMWMTALVGMATKYAEAVLAVKYREVDALGKHVGGPMYYIRNGLGSNWRWLAFLFALFGMVAAFGIGNMVQANSVADVMQSSFDIPAWLTGVVIAMLAAAVILGGIQRIAVVSAKLVPFMAIAYIIGSMAVIITHISELPAALSTIVTNAFTGTAASGGFAGAAVWAAIRFGVARGVFSNESGMGSAPIAHAAAKSNSPVEQGMIGMLGTFIDTIVVCSMTALVIIMTGAWDSGETGASLSTLAFETGIPGGRYIVTFGLVIFAFTTVIGWSYYGERCAEYIFGIGVILPYRVAWIIFIVIGAVGQLSIVWIIADILNGLMAIPNLIALALLSPVIFQLTRDYFNNVK